MSGCSIDRHTMEVPNEADDCQILAVVRHPLDRLVRLWHYLVRWDAMHGRATMAFYIFAAHVGRRDTLTIAGDPFYVWNLCDHLVGVPERTKFVKLESLAADLAAEGLTAELTRSLESHPQPWQIYYHSGLLATVEAWAKPDLESFGYESAPPGRRGTA